MNYESKDELLIQPRASRDLELVDGCFRAFGRIKIEQCYAQADVASEYKRNELVDDKMCS